MTQNTSSPARPLKTLAHMWFIAALVFVGGLAAYATLTPDPTPAPPAQTGMFNPDADLYTDTIDWIAAPACTTDRDCANKADDYGLDPEADPHTKGKRTEGKPGDKGKDKGKDKPYRAPKGTGHSEGQTVPGCGHIDWSDVAPYDANRDGYIDCGSDIELGA